MDTDAVRRFWDKQPCNARHSQAQDPLVYSQEVTARKYLVEPHLVEFTEFAKWKGKRVLDLGCGIGTQSISFAMAGANVTAVDLSPVSLEIAAGRIRAHGLEDKIRLVCADMQKLGSALPARPYDLVYAWGTIHHCPNPERVLAETKGFMGPHSVLKIMLYHKWSAKGLQTLFRYGGWLRSASTIGLHSEAQQGSPVTWLYSRREARELLYDFEIDDLCVDHIFPYRIPDYIKGQYVREWYWRMMPDWLFRKLERTFGWHMMITAKRRR